METGQPRHHGSALVDVDAFDLLSDDHRLVREYFQHIETISQTATAADRHRKPDLIKQLCDELDIHAQIEEEIFYPAVRAAFKETDDALVDEAVHEHGEAKALIAELRALGPDDDARADELLARLREAVEHHVHEEEERMFTLARPQIDAMAVGRQLRQQKQSLQERMFGKC